MVGSWWMMEGGRFPSNHFLQTFPLSFPLLALLSLLKTKKEKERRKKEWGSPTSAFPSTFTKFHFPRRDSVTNKNSHLHIQGAIDGKINSGMEKKLFTSSLLDLLLFFYSFHLLLPPQIDQLDPAERFSLSPLSLSFFLAPRMGNIIQGPSSVH